MKATFHPRHNKDHPRILIVEDSDVIRLMLNSAFKNRHFTHTAPNVTEGWKLYLEMAPDMVFLDIGLPDGNGHDLARRIKEHNPATYIVMVTASHDVGDKVSALQNHVDGYILKPFSKKDANGCIEKYLMVRGSRHKP
jgi:two-component system, chemotaxis family, chemotaxis protein CheY